MRASWADKPRKSLTTHDPPSRERHCCAAVTHLLPTQHSAAAGHWVIRRSMHGDEHTWRVCMVLYQAQMHQRSRLCASNQWLLTREPATKGQKASPTERAVTYMTGAAITNIKERTCNAAAEPSRATQADTPVALLAETPTQHKWLLSQHSRYRYTSTQHCSLWCWEGPDPRSSTASEVHDKRSVCLA